VSSDSHNSADALQRDAGNNAHGIIFRRPKASALLQIRITSLARWTMIGYMPSGVKNFSITICHDGVNQ
jgi:hypothetical protein